MCHLTERPVDAVEADEDDDPECLVKTALKWTCHLKHYFLNYDTTVSLESDLQEVISSSALDLMLIWHGTNFNNKLLKEAKFGFSCIAASPQLRPQINGLNGDRNTGVVLYISIR